MREALADARRARLRPVAFRLGAIAATKLVFELAARRDTRFCAVEEGAGDELGRLDDVPILPSPGPYTVDLQVEDLETPPLRPSPRVSCS